MALAVATPIRRLAWAGPAVAALVLAVLLGALLPLLGTTAIALALGVVLLVLTARWPALWLLGVVALTSTIFQYAELPRVGSAGTSLYLPEVLLLIVVGASLYWVLRARPRLATPPLTAMLVAAILIATGLSVLAGAVLYGRPIQEQVSAGRFMALYALYFPARYLLGKRDTYRWLLIGLLALAGLTAVVYDLVVLTPLRDALVAYPWFAATIQNLYVSPTLDAIEAGRVYMPGRALIQVLLFPALVLAVTLSPGSLARRAAIALSVLLVLSVVLIFTRAVWLTTLLAFALLVALAAGRLRRALLQITLVGLVAAILVAVASTVFDEPGRLSPVEIVWNRFSTIVVDNINDENFAFRVREAQMVIDRVDDRWITGSGFGAALGEQWVYDASSGQYGFASIFAYHNGYLSLLLNAGLLALVPFLTLCAVVLFFVCGRRWREPHDPLVLAGGLGFGVSLVRVLMNGLTESTFSDSFTVPLLVVSLAFLERAVIDWRTRQAELASA